MTCEYCKGEPEPGWIEMDNNGPVVCCPVCNPDGDAERAWEMAEAEAQRQEDAKWLRLRREELT